MPTNREVFQELLDSFGAFCFAGGKDPENDPNFVLAKATRQGLIDAYDAVCEGRGSEEHATGYAVMVGVSAEDLVALQGARSINVNDALGSMFVVGATEFNESDDDDDATDETLN